MQSKQRVAGSVSKKIVATDLQEERDKCDFDQAELNSIFNSDKELNAKRKWYEDDMYSDPLLRPSHHYYE